MDEYKKGFQAACALCKSNSKNRMRKVASALPEGEYKKGFEYMLVNNGIFLAETLNQKNKMSNIKLSITKDSNNNKALKVKVGNNPTYQIQTLQNLPLTCEGNLEYQVMVDELISYIRKFGTLEQKRQLCLA